MTAGPWATPRVSLVVVNYNTAELAVRLVAEVGDGADEIVVVDNASAQPDRDHLSRLPGQVKVIDAGMNLGYGAGANLGARECTGDVVVIANADIEIAPQALRELASQAGDDTVGLAAPRFLGPDGALIRSCHRRDPGLLTTLWDFSSLFGGLAVRLRPGWHPTLVTDAEHGHDRDAVHVLGALMAVRAEAFRAVDGFDESFFLYREETDLCARLRAGGWRIRHVAHVTAHHVGDASSTDDRPVPIRPVAVRSHYAYLRKHRGQALTALAWVLGLLGSLSWWLIGPRRHFARDSLRAHLGLLR